METWALLAIKLGVVLTVLALGLRSSFDDATYLLRRPTKLAKAILSVNVLMPFFIAVLIRFTHLRPAVAIALIALAISPLPPTLPRKAMSSGGSASYTLGLLVAISLLAIILVPAAEELIGAAVGSDVTLSVEKVVAMVAATLLLPVGVGLLLRRLAPNFALRAARPTSIVGTVLMIVGVLPLLVVAMPVVVRLLGDGTLAAVVAFIVVGLAIGHALGGPEPEERTVLALTTATRHPGVAFVIASANFADRKELVAALVLYMLVAAIASIPYQSWSKRRHAKLAHAMAT